MEGACRTASGGPGKLTTISADASGCERRCASHAACVAYELGPANRCELHVDAITKVEVRDGHVCWLREARVVPPGAGFEKMAGACRTASGGSGKFTTISAGASGCEARCDAHGACVAFELGPANRCELHIEAIAKAEARDGYECWVREAPVVPPGAGFEKMAGACRTASGGSGNFTTISADSFGCEGRCALHAACVAYELGPSNRCELHIEAIAKAEARDGYECWARTRPTPPPADECPADFAAPQVDRDLAGELLKEVSGASAAACCAECDEVAGCEGYAYDAKWEKCYLKGPVMGTYEHAGIVARIRATPSAEPPAEPKPPTCSADWGELQKDQDLAGELIKEMSGSSEAACCDECDKVSGCEGYSYDQWKKCYLKGSVTSSYKHAGVVARMKKRPMQQ